MVTIVEARRSSPRLPGANLCVADDGRVGGSAVFEDALPGVEVRRAGAFGNVVGVDLVGQANALRKHGASVVGQDLAEL